MKNLHNIMLVILLSMVTLGANAKYSDESWEKWGPTSKSGWGVIARIGYSIGGTTPLPLPAEIRSMNSFKPHAGQNIGLDVYKMFNKRWGLSFGAHVALQGFTVSADVKNYYMSYKETDPGSGEENEIFGWFTGRNKTSTKMLAINIPVLATFRLSPRWNMSFGPYFQILAEKEFTGTVDDAGKNDPHFGYIRVDEMDPLTNQSMGLGPTGQRVDITSDKPIDYEFSEDMRRFNCGIQLGFDWKCTQHMNLFAKLDWGLMNIWPKNFGSVQFAMYPVFGTLGFAYRY